MIWATNGPGAAIPTRSFGAPGNVVVVQIE